MAKDEAWKAHVEEYDRDRFDSTSRHRRHCFDAGWEAALDAHAQACVDAALEIERNTIIVQEANHDEGQYEEEADTLGLLETAAKRVNFQVDLVWRTGAGHDMRTLSVAWDTGISATPYYRYWYQDYVSGEDVPERELTRDDALALLAGEEKKGGKQEETD